MQRSNCTSYLNISSASAILSLAATSFLLPPVLARGFYRGRSCQLDLDQHQRPLRVGECEQERSMTEHDLRAFRLSRVHHRTGWKRMQLRSSALAGAP